MNKTLMLCAIGALACCFAPPTDGGGSPATPLLDGANPGAASPAPGTDADTAPESNTQIGNASDNAAETNTDPGNASGNAAAAAAASSAPKAAANPRTAARLDPTRKPAKTGARPRKAAPSAKKETDDAIVGIVLQTSRVTGSDGRAIPRRTVALAKAARAETLTERGWARAATEAETATATVVLD